MNRIVKWWGVGIVFGVLGFGLRVYAQVNVWSGSGNASDESNWSLGVVPQSDHQIVLDNTSIGDMTWDAGVNGLPESVASWTQSADYTGTVTIPTRFPGQGAFSNFVISGNVTIEGGEWTHPQNSGNWDETDRLAVSIGGNFTLGADAVVNAYGTGFAIQRGPGYGLSGQSRTGASHGGHGAVGDQLTRPLTTYGSVFVPVNLGSGGGGRGGGAIWLDVSGTATINGVIDASGDGGYRRSGGSGGSVYLRASHLSGDGIIKASGGPSDSNTGSGGGGRVAVVLTDGTDFGDVTMQAFGESGTHHASGAGTVYRQTAGQGEGEGTLIVDNNNLNENRLSVWLICALIPDAVDYPAEYALMRNEAHDLSGLSAIIVTNQGVLALNANTVFDFGTANILGGGASDKSLWDTVDAQLAGGEIAVRGTNYVTFPDPFVVSNYALSLDVPVVATGDWTILPGGALSHSANGNTAPGDPDEFRLQLELFGNLTIAAGAAVDVNTKGYYRQSGPAPGPSGQAVRGASHGGLGGWGNNDPVGRPTHGPLDTYGSILTPVTLGSGGNGGMRPGGGAVELNIHGTTTVDGVISARQIVPSGSRLSGASGGSIWLRTDSLEGSGALEARGGPSHGNTASGGGGRIAVVLRESDSFGNVTMDVRGVPGTGPSAAGTIYRETASQGRGRGVVTFDNDGLVVIDEIRTQIPPPNYAVSDELRNVTLVITNAARVELTRDVFARNLYLATDHPETRLYLNGYTLKLSSLYHPDWGHEDWVVYDGGRILWAFGTLIRLR